MPRQYTGRIKKPALFGTPEFNRMFAGISKAALVDALWCSNQLGTNETPEQITASAARNARIALQDRGDRVPPAIEQAAETRIDSDPEEA